MEGSIVLDVLAEQENEALFVHIVSGGLKYIQDEYPDKKYTHHLAL